MSSRIFATNLRKFVRVPPREVYDSLVRFLQEDLDGKNIKSEEKDMIITTKLRGVVKTVGFTANIHILPENDSSAIELGFSYRGFIVIALTLLVGIITLSIILLSAIPLIGIVLIFLLLHCLSSASGIFLGSINDFLLLLERDYDQRLLFESRKRWQSDPRRTDDLYKRLVNKHTKVWGDGHALEYKLSEYMRMGLTREEAIRKVAEEEGIF